MPVVEQLDRRTLHLLDAAKIFSKTNPELSSFLGSQLVEYVAQNIQRQRTILPIFCMACGMQQISGLSATVSIETARPKGLPTRCKPARRTTSSGSGSGSGSSKASNNGKARKKSVIRSSLKTTCHSCKRFTSEPLHKPGKPKKDFTSSTGPPLDTNKWRGMPTSGTGAMSVATDTVVKKGRRKQNKGGLAAMLALAKSKEGSKGSMPALGFADFASRR